jgi:hypothetical protein
VHAYRSGAVSRKIGHLGKQPKLSAVSKSLIGEACLSGGLNGNTGLDGKQAHEGALSKGLDAEPENY